MSEKNFPREAEILPTMDAIHPVYRLSRDIAHKISIQLRENLPMPLIFLATADDLARWQIDQLLWAYEQGHRTLAVSCFNTAAMGFDVAKATPIVIAAIVDFLCEHKDVAQLSILCGDDETYRAYSTYFYRLLAALHED